MPPADQRSPSRTRAPPYGIQRACRTITRSAVDRLSRLVWCRGSARLPARPPRGQLVDRLLLLIGRYRGLRSAGREARERAADLPERPADGDGEDPLATPKQIDDLL